MSEKQNPAGGRGEVSLHPHFNIGFDFGDNSAASNRARLLAALKSGPVTTIQARRDLDVLAPAPRILELRAMGYKIITFPVDAETKPGRRHRRIAMYVLTGVSDGGEHA